MYLEKTCSTSSITVILPFDKLYFVNALNSGWLHTCKFGSEANCLKKHLSTFSPKLPESESIITSGVTFLTLKL